MKLFTALSLPPHIVNALSPFVSGQPLENMHITLAYIGEVPDVRLSHIEQAIMSRPAMGAFPFVVEGIGYFPNARAPRIMWAGVSPVEPLRELTAAIWEALNSAGVSNHADGHAYTPHVTLARMDGIQPGSIQHPNPFGYFEAECFHLYRSDRGAYTQLSSFPL